MLRNRNGYSYVFCLIEITTMYKGIHKSAYTYYYDMDAPLP